VSLKSNGLAVYTPETNFFGQDSFAYIVNNGRGGIAIGEALVTVLPVQDPPMAVDDRVITEEDIAVRVDPLPNDSDPDGESIAVVEFTQPTYGRVERDGAAFVYSPNRNANGLDEFSYTIEDPHGARTQGRITIMVKPVNDIPEVSDEQFTLNKNASQNIAFTAIDAESDTLTYAVVKGPDNGELWSYPTVATYYPKKGFVGTDRITYQANDGQVKSREATVTFRVIDANNPPTANSQSVVTKQNQPLSITLTGTDLDEEPITFQILQGPAHGTLTGESPTYLFTPEPGYLGSDKFTFQAFDGKSASAETTVHIKVTDQNTTPKAEDFTVELKVNTSTNILLKATDGEGTSLSFKIATLPANGALTGDGPSVTYTPRTDFIGSDRFTFTAHDGELESNVGTVTLVVREQNQMPDARDLIITVPANRPSVIQLPVHDPDGDSLFSAILKGPRHGRLTGLGTTFTYLPRPGFVGGDTFTYKTWDGTIYSLQGKITLSVVVPSPDFRLKLESVDILGSGNVRIVFKAQIGRTYELQASANLIDWTSVGTATATSDTVTFNEPAAQKFEFRFYRARQL
jgi:large repetitive protein